ncbi:MAG: FAD-dependent oxidoreductase [Candidatus Malihini olakiniferum]
MTAIDRQRRCLIDVKGRAMPYPTSVLATGSYPFVPRWQAAIVMGAWFIIPWTDLDAIADYPAQSHSGGVVIGGGLLGLEAANALRPLGLETHVVEFAPHLMAVQLDDGGAAMLRRIRLRH